MLAFRRALKFLHTLGAAGFMGGMAALVIMATLAPASAGGAGYAPMMGAMGKIAAWVVGPSMVVTVMSGLAAIAINPGFHEAGWAWLKALTGVLIFEGSLHVMGPLQEEAKRGAGALAAADPAGVARLLSAETNTLWVMLAVSAVNVALGVWRPKMPDIPV